ncbi:MAG: nucleoside-diphosphate kinase [Patescibacteria group bacterium]
MAQHSESIERTLVLLKTDAVNRGLVGEILHRFERTGLKIIGLKMVWSDKDTAMKHYTEDVSRRRGEKVRERMIKMITSGPIIAIAIEGVEAVEVVRKMVGTTEPKQAAPGTIRGDYAHVSFTYADANEIGIFNLIHASANIEEAAQEIGVWFNDFELQDYHPDYTRHTITIKE